MPPKEAKSNTLSEKEMQVLALSWQCMEGEPKVDFTKLAVLAGYTEGSAKTIFGGIKRKIKAMGTASNSEGSNGTTTTDAAKNGGKGDKADSNSNDDNSEESGAKEKAALKPKSTPRKRKTAAEKEEGNGTPTKRGRKSGGKGTSKAASPAKTDNKPKETTPEGEVKDAVKTEPADDDDAKSPIEDLGEDKMDEVAV